MYMIRHAVVEDIQFLLPLLKQLFEIEKDFEFDQKRQTNGLRMLIENDRSAVFVAEENQEIIGMVTGQLLVSTAEGGTALLLEDLVVHKKWRGKKIGGELLRAVSSWGKLRGAFRMQLLADTNNLPAISFYQKAGWQTTSLMCLRNYTGE